MLRTAFVAAFWMVAAAFLSPAGQAQALDLAQAEREGRIVAEALALGERGDWSGAEAIAARSGDLVVRDIVLWRKLRAGAGSVEEYRSFVARRGTWPGQDQLASAVLGARAAPEGYGGLRGQAAAEWERFSRLWRANDFDEAERLIDRVSVSAAALGDPGTWADRRARLARRAAREGRSELAYRIASRHYTTSAIGYDYSDLEWISGWVALRQLRDPKTAVMHFERFEASVDTPISLGRAGYWTGRAFEAMGDIARANAAYQRGARHQTSFYGQLAAARIGAPGDRSMAGGTLPDWRTSPAMRSDDVRMAAILHYAGQDALAWQTFSHLGRTLDGEAALGALAGLAMAMGQDHFAVRVSKNAAGRGVLLHAAYFPVTELSGYVTKVEPAFAMAIARQETELNPRAISPAGARGLMQLMPATAQRVAGWIGEDYSAARLIEDWRYNARLGQTYLAQRVSDFDGSYAMAAAAYNAGKGRVDQWIAAYGDPRRGDVDMIDWLEMIPFSETRNYVQRVMEGIYVYRTRISGEAGPMTIERDLTRGFR